MGYLRVDSDRFKVPLDSHARFHLGYLRVDSDRFKVPLDSHERFFLGYVKINFSTCNALFYIMVTRYKHS
ncbi:MAG: hypothetical protein R8J84_00950, partial [Mariprofundales bacterium]